MSPTVQTAIAVLLVLLAATYVGRRAWRTIASARSRRTAGGCGDSCGCGESSAE